MSRRKRKKNPRYPGGMNDQILAASNKLGTNTVRKAKALAARMAKKFPYEKDRYYLLHEIIETLKQRLDDAY